MSHHKLDRLFREKSETYQVTPGRQSWAEIESQLPKRKNSFGMYWKAAAAVIVLLSISLIVYDQMKSERSVPAGITIDQPAPIDRIEIKIPGKTTSVSTELMASVTSPEFSDQKNTGNTEESINSTPKSMIAILEVAKKHPDISINVPNTQFSVQTIVIGTSRVKIEYYADATEEEDDASKGKIGKLLEKARATSPADLLADIREAKDNFINSTLNLD